MTLPTEKVKRERGRPATGERHTSLHISVPNEVRDVIERYAAARKQRMSKAVTELLVAMTPSLERLIEAMQVVDSAPKEAVDRARRALDKAIDEATGVVEQLDLLDTSKKKGGHGGPTM